VSLRVYLFGYPTNMIPFHSKRALLWRFNVAGLLTKCPIFLRDFDLIQTFLTDSHKSPENKILRKSVHWEPQTDTDRLADGRDEVNRYFRKYANEPNKIVNVWKIQDVHLSKFPPFFYPSLSILNKLQPQ